MQNNILKKNIDTSYFFLVTFVHALFAITYKMVLNLDVEKVSWYIYPWRWDSMWQTIPMEILKTDLFNSLLNLHSQPPLFNLLGGFLGKAFSPNLVLNIIYALNILFGSLLCGCIYSIIYELTSLRLFSLVSALLFSINTSIFLYEILVYYTIATTFFLVASVFCLAMFKRKKNNYYLYSFIVFLNLAVLIRSMYHIVILVFGIFTAYILSEKDCRKVLIISLALSMFSFGWYTKNYVKFGFFGASSWLGFSLWQMSTTENEDAVKKLVKRGICSNIVLEEKAFSLPSNYKKYGFNKTSSIPCLSNNDFNNINILKISNLYFENALKFIKHYPMLYCKNIIKAYKNYCIPSSYFPANKYALNKLHYATYLTEEIIKGGWMSDKLTKYINIEINSYSLFLLPLLFLYSFVMFIKEVYYKKKSLVNYIKENIILLFCLCLIFYTTLISVSTVIVAENMRFFFNIEPLFFCCLVWMVNDLRWNKENDGRSFNTREEIKEIVF